MMMMRAGDAVVFSYSRGVGVVVIAVSFPFEKESENNKTCLKRAVVSLRAEGVCVC